MRAFPVRRATAVVTATLVLAGLPALALADAPARSVTAATDRSEPGSVRQIPLQGAINVRDLGGYRTDSGRQVRYGQVCRADARLTDQDLSALSALGLRTVLDFRTPEEVERDGADRLPAGLAATLRDIADGGRGALLFHCTSGKDRTGWTGYLLLRTVGVPSGAAERDFLLSNAFRAEADRRLRAGLKQAGSMEDPDLLIPLQEVRAAYLDAALDAVTEEYDGFHGYLFEGLGLDVRTVAKLHARLLR
ncbi:tyrosine-protein phosphatase [Streptomyces sp. NPDC051742]|uniref:tyrosine-protein phosphatase n=1 Tax=unclassified Streptomyces TaxID=2593676 RepID=UPI003420ECE1